MCSNCPFGNICIFLEVWEFLVLLFSIFEKSFKKKILIFLTKRQFLIILRWEILKIENFENCGQIISSAMLYNSNYIIRQSYKCLIMLKITLRLK